MLRIAIPALRSAACTLLAIALAACATSSAEPSRATLRKERIESWRKLCSDRGFTPGTSDFNDCVMGYDREAQNPPIK